MVLLEEGENNTSTIPAKLVTVGQKMVGLAGNNVSSFSIKSFKKKGVEILGRL
jgi:hypothetical protein